MLAFLRTPMTMQEIADKLSVSVNTLKTHQRAIYRKLGAANCGVEAIARAPAGSVFPRAVALVLEPVCGVLLYDCSAGGGSAAHGRRTGDGVRRLTRPGVAPRSPAYAEGLWHGSAGVLRG